MEYETALAIVRSCKHELQALTDEKNVEGYAAQDEIEEAVSHLDAAIIDLENGRLNDHD